MRFHTPLPLELCPVLDTPWGRGHDAAMRGDPLDSCPYSYDSPAEIEAAAEWQSGWNDATHGER